MANSTKNSRALGLYPEKFNKRENRLITYGYTAIVADSDFSIDDTDGIQFVRADATGGDVTATLPKAATNKGRVITFLLGTAATNSLIIAQNADDANIDGADANFTALDADDDWIDLYCTGDEWIIVRQSIA